MEWQPIETFPRDFKDYDVWSSTQGRIPDCSIGLTTYRLTKQHGIVYQADYDCDGPIMELVPCPTHWMKIEPPKEK